MINRVHLSLEELEAAVNAWLAEEHYLYFKSAVLDIEDVPELAGGFTFTVQRL